MIMNNRHLQLVKLDHLALSSYWKFLLLFFALGIVNALFDSSGITTLILISFIANTIIQSYLFGPEDKYDLNRLYASLPVTNKDIVFSRYLSSIILSAEIYVPFILLAIVVALFKNQSSILPGFFSMLGMSYGLSLIFVSIEFPLLYRFGFSKAQFIQAIPFIIAIAVVLLMRQVFGIDILSHFSVSIHLTVILILIGLGALLISFFVACKIRNKKLD